MKKPVKPVISSPEAVKLLAPFRIKLDCGHWFQVHPLSNTLVITADGKTYCHSCYS
jgi:hypothetical protein